MLQGSYRSWKTCKVMGFVISVFRPGKSWNLLFQFQAWKVMGFVISIFRPGKSWDLLFQFSGLESHGVCYFNFQAWKVLEFVVSIFMPGKSWNLSEGHGKSWKSNMLGITIF